MTPPRTRTGRDPVPPAAERIGQLERELLRVGRDLARLHRELAGEQEQGRLERADREDLLATVSHELRTPLTVISGYNRLLLREEVGPLNPKQCQFLEESQRSCQRLDAFVENLLEASRASRGHEVLEVGRTPLAPLIHGMATMFRPLLEERDLRLCVELDPAAPEARIDAARIEQVLTNLVGNAVKYTPAGGSIEITTRVLDAPADPQGRRWVEICVGDDGPGIAPGDRERVFEPYVRAGEGQSAGGLGLGLAICRRLVEAHGGSIGLEEPVGGGCRLRFTLPAEPPRPVTGPVDAPPLGEAGRADGAAS